MPNSLAFDITATDPNTRARAGVIHTFHGDIPTPAFMPVATQASVKGLSSDDLLNLDVPLLIANTYHLMLRPGASRIANLGGLHKFMHWERAISTDSGGFQVFSLGAAIRDGVGKIADIFPDEAKSPTRWRPHSSSRSTKDESAQSSSADDDKRISSSGSPMVKIDEDGVSFTSHLDGSHVRLTPENSIEIQQLLGADFILAFDECTSPLDTYDYTRLALGRTHRWAVRCLQKHTAARRDHQSLFGIVQGGAFKDLRFESAQFIGNMPFEGLAIGGSLGRSKGDMHSILEWTIPSLPEAKPRHLLGIGELEDIVECVDRGVDLFDCAAPTRWARNGALIVSRKTALTEGLDQSRITISNARFNDDPAPVDADCSCSTCRQYSRAYLHHLHRARELSYYRLASIHNLHFMVQFMSQVRQAIAQGKWKDFRAAHLQT